MKKRSLLSLLLVLALCVGLLAGCGGEEPAETTEKPTETTEEPTETTEEPTDETIDEPEVYGDWFVMSESYDPDGIPILQTFYLPEGADTATCYSINGQELFEADVTWYDGAVEIEAEFSTAYFIYDGEALYDPDTLAPMFVRTEDPDFPEPPDCDGTWVRVDNTDAEEYLVFDGSSYAYYTENYGDEPEQSGTWSMGPNQYMLHTGEILESIPTLKAEFPGPDFYLNQDGTAIYMSDGFGYLMFVNASAELTEEDLEHLLASASLLNCVYQSDDPDAIRQLFFHPAYFEVLNPNDPEEFAKGGTWEIDENGDVYLTYTDGAGEIISLDDPGELYMPSLDVHFPKR